MDPFQKKKNLDLFVKYIEMNRPTEIMSLSDHIPVSVPDDAGPSPPSPPPPSPSSPSPPPPPPPPSPPPPSPSSPSPPSPPPPPPLSPPSSPPPLSPPSSPPPPSPSPPPPSPSSSPPPPSPSSLLGSLSLSTSATSLFQECCICLNDYNAKQDLNSVFNCGHQLCFRCSTSLLFDSPDYTFNCPLCRAVITKIVFCDYFVENHQPIDGQIFLRSFADTILHCETEEVYLRCEERLLYKCTYGIDDECRSVNFWAPITPNKAQELFLHVSREHYKYFCIKCLLKFKPFANQMTMFDNFEYLDHVINGVEVDGERVFHRYCTLCWPQPYFCYDFEELRSHCERLHLKCRFCVENPVFVRNRVALVKHINLVHPDSDELNRR
ncbi:hypothetical protein SSS_01490 [Sarcoptes scabiei]|uniref:RING-type domain-containing protein n=1 Tax=Sarcoptes scabiei TaxID=52283 RepID=A0A834RE05_SARSC|nr:hypothetical protein SSS_01490 [Sarcoptes scabiei]